MLMEKEDARIRALSLCEITEEQQVIIDIFLREKAEKLRHWERRSGDNNIYVEYLNGCLYLEHLIDREISKINNQNQKKKK
jgi:hypothetical protein